MPGCQVLLSAETCELAMSLVRQTASNFRRIEKGEEPPLRVLSHGLHGESVPVVDGQPPPYPYMMEKNKQWYHAFRMDSFTCDAPLHSTARLQERFGAGGMAERAYFRSTIGYSSGAKPWSLVDESFQPLVESLYQAVASAALETFGASAETPAPKVYSMYVLAMLPGHAIDMHLDVPEFAGVDRATTPSWLLVCALCSGLFAKRRVHNATCVFYPCAAETGFLAIYPSIPIEANSSDSACEKMQDIKRRRICRPEQDSHEEGQVQQINSGCCVVFDADTCFHHSEMLGGPATAGAARSLPEDCSLAARKSGDGWEWVVLDNDGHEVAAYPESAMRFSISYKLHVQKPDEKEQLTTASIVQELTAELQRRGRFDPSIDIVAYPPPLVSLAPLMVDEFVKKKAPTTKEVEAVWAAHDSVMGG